MKAKFSKPIGSQPIETAIIRRPNHQIPVFSLLATLLLFLTLNFQAVAQTGSGGGNFPTMAQAERASSFACFRIWVDPTFYFLVSPGGTLLSYPGWNGTTLTSPGLSDQSTIVGESMGYNNPPLPTDYPVDIGGVPNVPVGNPSLGDYMMPFPFQGLYPNTTWPYPSSPPTPLRTMLTELQSATLVGFAISNGCASSALLPVPTGTSPQINLYVGYLNGVVSLPRSVGMVQTITSGADFTARSFFGVWASLSLPEVPGTVSASTFPTTGAVLTNGTPLFVLNDSVDGLPPTLGYYHDPSTLAVPLIFAKDNPNPGYPGDGSGKPYWWHAGDVFGNLELAGHGLFDPCAKNNAANQMIAQIFGTQGHAGRVAPVGGLYPGTSYIWPHSTYSMIMGTNFVGTPNDTITFSNATTLSAAYLTASNFLNPVALPTPGNSVIYTNPNTAFSIEWSPDGQNYYTGSATGSVGILITNSTGSINGTTTYGMQLQAMNLTGTSFFGNFMLSLSTNKASLGNHIVTPEAVGVNIGGYFNALFRLSLNGGVSWNDADLPVNIRLMNPPCGANLAKVYVQPSGANNEAISWLNPSFSLVGSTSLNPAVWVPISSTSPAIVPAAGPYKFFKLTCD
jgi:hypothetical protein